MPEEDKPHSMIASPMLAVSMSNIKDTREALTNILVNTMAFAPGQYDVRTLVEFVEVFLKTHAWVIREELVASFIMEHSSAGTAPTMDTLLSVFESSQSSRVKLSEYLCEHAHAILAQPAGSVPAEPWTNH